ncbi:hypothetical protein E4U43_005598 [Claviceps pusilla]|uniref:Myb-like domain-containing protein n=1 Tax=Claviceps pusilla TaxID=123648 RepID=A0A9P7N2E8_9HYPO|nr:hypothetical protein E4U43_005598 [Claviceps pusilla]
MYSAIRQNGQCGDSSPAYNRKMGIRAITREGSSTPRRMSDEIAFNTLPKLSSHPHTPPESASGSPRLKLEGPFWNTSRDCSPLPSIARLDASSTPPVKLPSLEEFDLGVEALARSYGPARPYTPSSPLPSLRRSSMLSQPSRSSSMSTYASQEAYSPYHMNDMYMHPGSHLDGYPSPPPDGENRHINQKYTTEEGDFIIYAWHDKKLKWQRIKQDFAAMFGRTPERTVQGLQAWYYRMNQRIPLWDSQGRLIFDHEDDLEPKHISIKCRERDSQDKPMEPLGLAQRYPERAIHYSWVDPELKHKSQDWALKRQIQYQERRERRKRKELSRLKL